MFLYKSNAVHAVCERQYTAADGEVQLSRGGSLLTSDGRQSEDIDTRIGKANTVLRELYRSVVTKRELSNTANLSVIESFFVPILTKGHESGADPASKVGGMGGDFSNIWQLSLPTGSLP